VSATVWLPAACSSNLKRGLQAHIRTRHDSASLFARRLGLASSKEPVSNHDDDDDSRCSSQRTFARLRSLHVSICISSRAARGKFDLK